MMSEGLPGDLFAGDPVDVERGLDEWVVGFERNAARYRELQHRVEEVRLCATSPSGVVTVTVDADGTLIDARFSDRVRQTSPDELSRQLLGAINRAKAGIVGKVREVAEETLGPDARDSADRIVGYYGQRFPGIGEPDAGVPKSDRGRAASTDDEDFGESSIFDRRR
jgi:DNA-binding protein YbaB